MKIWDSVHISRVLGKDWAKIQNTCHHVCFLCTCQLFSTPLELEHLTDNRVKSKTITKVFFNTHLGYLLDCIFVFHGNVLGAYLRAPPIRIWPLSKPCAMWWMPLQNTARFFTILFFLIIKIFWDILSISFNKVGNIVAHLQVVVAKAVWGIFNDTHGLYFQVNTLLVNYKSQY